MFKHNLNTYKILKKFKFIKKTPLQCNKRLSRKYNANIYFKREDLQTTRSFKIRGSLNKIYNTIVSNNLDTYHKKKKYKIVTASAGNHAQGVGYVSDYFNMNSIIFIPENTPNQKVKSIEKYNSNIIKIGNNFDETLHYCKEYLNNNDNCFFIHPFDDINIVKGQGTILDEIINDIEPDIICSAIGGGGLMAGLIHNYTNNYSNKNIKFYGIEPHNSCGMFNSIIRNKVITLKNMDTFVDGASVKKVGCITYNIIKNNINNIIKIKNNNLCYDLIDLYQNDGIVSELAGTLPVSALRYLDKEKIQNKNIVCIISGGNNDINRIPEYIRLSNGFRDSNIK